MLPLQLYTSAGRFNEFLLEKLLFRLALVGNSCGYVELVKSILIELCGAVKQLSGSSIYSPFFRQIKEQIWEI